MNRQNRMNKRAIFLVVYSFIIMMTIGVAAERLFRYKDEEGKVVVSSILPPEASQNGYDIVTKMGVVVKTIDPRKTKEQLEADLAEKARLEEEEAQQREQDQLDSILLNSYTDIIDIERARDRELTSKQRDVMLLKQNVRRLTRMLEDTQKRAARDERLGHEISPSLQNDVDTFKKRIASENTEVNNVMENTTRIKQRYNSSIFRFNELKAEEQLRRHRPEELSSDKIKTVIYRCPSISICDEAWQTSLRYANDYSTTELAWANESTIMMRKPRKDNDISIVISKIDMGPDVNLVMELRCNKTQAGEALCNEKQTQAIYNGYIPYLKKTNKLIN
ncbi:MAG: hypothetical protein GY808_09605 [Gammaproteobacteria bacterium]|nr:hypothetical protein [Gammaproteobacteria bacterium]